MPASTVVVARLQMVILFVEPVNTLFDQVNGKTRRVEEFIFDDHATITAIHAYALDFSRL